MTVDQREFSEAQVGDAERPGTWPGQAGAGAWDLSTRQRALFSALATRGERLATMYAGACHVLQSGNPDRFAMAAHNFRELMEKLPYHVDVPTVDGPKRPRVPQGLTERVRSLQEQWTKISLDVESATEIDHRLKKFLKGLETFFVAFQEDYPKRRKLVIDALRGLDPSGQQLPPTVENHRFLLWKRFHEAFQRLGHHGSMSYSEDEFFAQVYEFEGFLMDCLQPQTFEDQAILDAIIKEGEQDA